MCRTDDDKRERCDRTLMELRDFIPSWFLRMFSTYRSKWKRKS